MFSTPTTEAKALPSPGYDKLSFIKYMKNIGRAYRKQSMELISLCRTYSQAQEQAPHSVARLRTVLEVVDEALGSAADAKNKTKKPSDKVDKAFRKAIDELESYESDCRLNPMVTDKMVEAKTNDIAVSTFLQSLKVRRSPKPGPPKVVEFHLVKSLPDPPPPIIVKQVLSHESKLPEVLWNFRRFKEDRDRLTLKHNPHFYNFPDIPMTRREYSGEFLVDPIEDFRHATNKFWVITDKPGRIFLKTPQHRRAFVNVWRVKHNKDKNVIIFKDICGKLEGEGVINTSINSPSDRVWNLEGISYGPSPTSPPPVGLPSRSSPSNTANAATPSSSTTSSAPDESFPDWRDPIRRRLNESPETETDICISAAVRLTDDSSSPPSSPSLTSPPGGPGGHGTNDNSGNSNTNQSSHSGTQRRPSQCTYSIIAWSVSDMGVLGGRPEKKGT